MTNTGYYFEIRKLLLSFVAGFDNIVIKRYDKGGTAQSLLQVRYVYSPKERVIFDLNNLAQNITMPVVSVSLGSITRANDRVFNKVPGFYLPKQTSDNPPFQLQSSYFRTPVPVDIVVNMSIITKFQSDMDQILSNFVPYSNPYIILSWQIPSDFNLANSYEIRSEVLWSDSISLQYPVEVNASNKWRITADTSFTIKGWLFPATPHNTVGNIFYINSNFYNTGVLSLTSTYANLSGDTFTYPVSDIMTNELETVALSGLSATGDVSWNIYN